MECTPSLRNNIFLIGDTDFQILGNKLPSNKQVLKVLFYNVRVMKLSLRSSASLVVREVFIFWEKAEIPTQQECHCIDKLLSLHSTWRELQKHKNRSSNRIKEELYMIELDNLFDIAHQDALELINEENKLFLLHQRKPGRPGFIHENKSVKISLSNDGENENFPLLQTSSYCKVETETNTNSVEQMCTEDSSYIDSSQSTEGEYSNFSSQSCYADDGNDEPESKKPRGNMNFMNAKLVAVLDKCKLSNRNSVHVIIAVAQALNVDLSSYIINQTSIRRYREQIRAEKALHIKEIFGNVELDLMVLHWDGKLLPDLLNRTTVDRLPIVISSGSIEKLLGIPPLKDGKGLSQATAILDVLNDWGLSESIKALCCDTTASNLGSRNGAAIQLEKLLQKDLLFLPCRKHIFEIILKAVFDEKMPLTTGPAVPIFKRFREFWPEIDSTKFNSCLEDREVQKYLTHGKSEHILAFVEVYLTISQPRDDYREFLELTQLFLGRAPSQHVKIRPPGAFHHARWMAKAIYSLKIYLYRDSFQLNSKELRSIREICIFIVTIYVEAWFTASSAITAPSHDLEFLKKIVSYESIDKNISNVALRKFKNHLWYLSPEPVALAFFDINLTVDVKRAMINQTKMEEDLINHCPKRFEANNIDIRFLCDKELDYFTSPSTLNFFRRFEIDDSFLQTDPSNWSENTSFVNSYHKVKNLKVVNDVAERAVCLIEEYNNILTKNENQKQYILQLVSEYRKRFSDSSKDIVLQEFE